MLGEDRHESLRERALGEQPPQQVRDAEGDEEGVGGEAGAESAGDDEVAEVAEDAAHQRKAAYRGQGTQEVHARISALFGTPSWLISSPPASAPTRPCSAASTTCACAPRCAPPSRT